MSVVPPMEDGERSVLAGNTRSIQGTDLSSGVARVSRCDYPIAEIRIQMLSGH